MGIDISGLLPGGKTVQTFLSNNPFIGSMFDDPAQKDLQKGIAKAAGRYEAYRPLQMDARMKALQSGLGMFQPAIAQLAKMYGSGAVAGLDPSKLYFPTAQDMGWQEPKGAAGLVPKGGGHSLFQPLGALPGRK